MSEFSSGVSGYIKASAVISVSFPINFNGNADVSCYQCRFYSQSSRKCNLNGEVPSYPSKHIGSECPFWPSLRGDDDNG